MRRKLSLSASTPPPARGWMSRSPPPLDDLTLLAITNNLSLYELFGLNTLFHPL